MQKVKMGGEKKTLRIFIGDNNDITDSLLSLQHGGQKLDLGINDLVHKKYHGLFNIEIIREPFGRSDLMIQQPGVVPEELFQHKLDDENFVTTQFKSRLFEEQVDVVVFSLRPEITDSLWRHRQKGYLFYPPPDWEKKVDTYAEAMVSRTILSHWVDLGSAVQREFCATYPCSKGTTGCAYHCI